MNRTELIAKVAAGEQFEYIPFWGGEMSQWLASPFTVHGIEYDTAEHYMMCEKARTFNDMDALFKIQFTHSPSEAKKIGRKVKGFSDAVWDKVKYETVVRGSTCKFKQNPELLKFLLDTGDAVLVEASPYDKVWGIGKYEADPDCMDPSLWDGENLLGFALMDAREILREAV